MMGACVSLLLAHVSACVLDMVACTKGRGLQCLIASQGVLAYSFIILVITHAIGYCFNVNAN